MNTYKPQRVPSELRRATQRSSVATITTYDAQGQVASARTTGYQSYKGFNAFMNWQADKKAARLGMPARPQEG